MNHWLSNRPIEYPLAVEHLHSSRFGHLLPLFLIEIEGGRAVGLMPCFQYVKVAGELGPRNALCSALASVLRTVCCYVMRATFLLEITISGFFFMVTVSGLSLFEKKIVWRQ